MFDGGAVDVWLRGAQEKEREPLDEPVECHSLCRPQRRTQTSERGASKPCELYGRVDWVLGLRQVVRLALETKKRLETLTRQQQEKKLILRLWETVGQGRRRAQGRG